MKKWLIPRDPLGSTDEELLSEFREIDAENLSYDYFKNLTSLSVLTLGGVLTLSEKVFAEQIEVWQMLVASGLVAAGGIVALQCQADIVQVSRGKKAPTSWLRYGHRLAPALFGGGIGAFMALLASSFV
ncbi:hypothetical protein Q9K02_07595 [Qipengyuania sp. G39]|uniref:Uncharacterized protein n=1 Tax=Qipengyuania profundimaris TaxID=3067652 RepID=A0ABT9HPR0_9SPHN|nr:hypothetical protein [Qipengyuania sp. G39]MDP4575000.1 hypothetical protein [Qipengyuania sp. G39]